MESGRFTAEDKFSFSSLLKSSSHFKVVKVAVVACFCIFASACMSETGKQKDSKTAAGQSTEAKNSDKPKVQGVQLASDGSILIKGSQLEKVTSVKIIRGTSVTSLSIDKASSQQIKAHAKTAFYFVMGTAYNLLISSASADDEIVPIVVEVPAGTFSPSAIKGSGASVGQVLKWNGTSWAPAAPDVGTAGPQGPQGQQGPQGPQGLQGIQGPAGAAFGGPNLELVDGNGSVVGPVVLSASLRAPTDSITVWDAITDSYITYRTESGTAYPSNSDISIYFKSSDCTGQPYVWFQDLRSYHVMYVGTSVYKAGPTIVKDVIRGSHRYQGSCWALSPNLAIISLSPLTQIPNVFPQQLTFPLTLRRF